jgi:RHS repeat-associated protein
VFNGDGSVKFFNIFAGNEVIGRYETAADTLKLNNKTLKRIYSAKNILTGANVNVTVIDSAKLKAGTSVSIKPGFRAYDGSKFNALIDASVLSPKRYYYLKDHLGSVRVTFNEIGEAVSYDDYDAWGFQLNGRSSNLADENDKLKFTSKERDVETGYDYFGARYYDSRIGRWLQVDPLADEYTAWSSYNYCLNNPTKNIDINGMSVGGHWEQDPSDKSKQIWVMDEIVVTPNNTNNKHNSSEKNNEKGTILAYNVSAALVLPIFGGPNFEIGIALNTNNGYAINFARFGWSHGFALGVGMEATMYDNMTLGEFKGDKPQKGMENNAIEIEGGAGIGGINLVFDSAKNNFNFLGGGFNYGAGFGASVNLTHKTGASSAYKLVIPSVNRFRR